MRKLLFVVFVLCAPCTVQACHTCTKIGCTIETIVKTTVYTAECWGSRTLAAPTRGVQRRVARRSDRRERKIERWSKLK